MKSAENAIEFGNWLKEGFLADDGSKEFSGEYQQGYFNGIEVIIAYIEERPQLFRDINKKISQTDRDRFPEHFL